MTAFTFAPATKHEARAKVALIGPSGSGKTYTALRIGTNLGERVAVIDTEHRTASKYADRFTFATVALDDFRPQNYIDAMRAAVEQGFDVVIVDSLSHAWMGKGGILEQVDAYGRSHSGNSFGGWRDATPQHNALIEAMVSLPAHLIVTMRVKTEYVLEKDDRGKSVPKRVGLAPVQRDGLEYEFDVVADLTLDNDLVVSKTRCSELRGAVIREAGEEVARTLRTWLSGDPVPPVQDMHDRALDPAATLDDLRALRADVIHYGYAQRQVATADGEPIALVDLIDQRGRALRAGTGMTRADRIAEEKAVAQLATDDTRSLERVKPDAPVEDEWTTPPATPVTNRKTDEKWLRTWRQRLADADTEAAVKALGTEYEAAYMDGKVGDEVLEQITGLLADARGRVKAQQRAAS